MWTYFKTKKLSILVVLAGISYVFLIVNTFINEWDSFKAGFTSGSQSVVYDSSNKRSQMMPQKRYYLSLKPKEAISNFPDSIVNLKVNEIIQSRYESAIVLRSSGSNSSSSLWYSIFLNVFMVIIFATYIIIPFHFYRLISKIRNNIVFERENIRLIRWLGVELLIVYFGNVLFNFMDYKNSTMLFSFSDYEIGMNSIDSIWLLFGIVVLLIAEILSKALVLKEEQELTI